MSKKIYKRINVNDETGGITRLEFLQYMKTVDKIYIPPISNFIPLNEYVDKLLSNAHLVSVRDDNILIGMCAFYINANMSIAYISTIGLKKQYIGQGIAQIMLNKVIEMSKYKNMKNIALEVSEENLKAVRFYKKNSFEIIEKKQKTDLFQNNHYMYIMVRKVK